MSIIDSIKKHINIDTVIDAAKVIGHETKDVIGIIADDQQQIAKDIAKLAEDLKKPKKGE